MFSQYFVHFGIVILPLLVYQLWAFRRSFTRLPHATVIIGLYGGLTAILSEMYPITIFGMAYDLKFIPIILSFLYGKRSAGLISLFISVLFRVYMGHSGVLMAALSMILYSIPPFVMAKRYDAYRPVKRLLTGVALSLVATVVQVLFIYIYYELKFPGHGIKALQPYLHSLSLGATLQILLIIPAVILLDHIVETGKVRTQLLDYQHSLEESQARYRSFLENNPEGISAFDHEGRFLFVNRAYECMLGYTAEELKGMDRLELWAEEDREIGRSIMQKVLDGEVLMNVEINLRNKKGEWVPVRGTVLPSVVAGQVTGYCCIISDMRAIKEAEDMIRKAERLSTVGELAPGIAHEIRNPLTALKGFLKLLKSHDPTTTRYVSIMENEIDRLEYFSGQLLVLARPQKETKRLSDLRMIVLDVIEFMQSEALLAGVELRTVLQAKKAYTLAIDNQIKQVLINMVKNAIEATPSGGTITITLEHRGAELVIQIQDTGVGIPEDVLKRLGEPFYTTKIKGTGLGLMVSHRIIDSHGGHVRYESREQAGTTVTVTLPGHEQMEDVHWFGNKLTNVSYTPRQGVYAVIVNVLDEEVAAVRTPAGVFLPGGAIEGQEGREECLKRECLKEIGYDIQVRDVIGRAARYFYSAAVDKHMLSDGFFYLVDLVGLPRQPAEDDHELVWVKRSEVRDQFYHEHHAWAIDQAFRSILNA